MKVTKVIVIPKDCRITLEFEDCTYWTDVIAGLNLYDWWNEFEGVGDLNLWVDDIEKGFNATIYPDANNMNEWYNPTLEIKK